MTGVSGSVTDSLSPDVRVVSNAIFLILYDTLGIYFQCRLHIGNTASIASGNDNTFLFKILALATLHRMGLYDFEFEPFFQLHLRRLIKSKKVRTLAIYNEC